MLFSLGADERSLAFSRRLNRCSLTDYLYLDFGAVYTAAFWVCLIDNTGIVLLSSMEQLPFKPEKANRLAYCPIFWDHRRQMRFRSDDF
jgi:hypothetical protein